VKRIILSRTDNLGDVILTLPMAGVLKQFLPDCHIIFLGKKYTKPVIDACEHVDEFLDWDEVSGIGNQPSAIRVFHELAADVVLHVFPVKEIQWLAKKAGIPLRVGTSHRWYSWLYCNQLLHYSRRKSELHEAQLNLKLLQPLGIRSEFSRSEIPSFYGLSKFALRHDPFDKDDLNTLIKGIQVTDDDERTANREGQNEAFKLILHPKSKGSAREWGLENFSKLIGLLPVDKFRIFVTGTRQEGEMMKEFLQEHEKRVTDLTGKLSLEELLAFINDCDGIVAASTGPLHIAAALGKTAIGLFAPMRPIFPERWAPLGSKASYLVLDKRCSDCRRSGDCKCIRSITPEQVAGKLSQG
jgi:heptosyltransferase III